jgi:hypothetical protein
MPDAFEIPLSEAVNALRVEIAEAVRAGSSEEFRFKLGPIELEFGVEMSRTTGAEAGLRMWVVSAGAKGERTSAATHTVRITLTPEGEDIVIADEDCKEPE